MINPSPHILHKPGLRTLRTSFQEYFILITVIVLSSIDLSGAKPTQKSIDRYQVLRMTAQTDSEADTIRVLQELFQLDPWRQIGRANSSGDFLVSPHHIQDLTQHLQNNSIAHQLLIEDAQSFLLDNDPLKSRDRTKRSASEEEFRHRFLTYNELRQFLRHIKDTATTANVELHSMGRSFEGRPMPYVKISSLNDSTSKPTIFIDGGIHSREWIAPTMSMEIIHRLALNTENDSEANHLVNVFNWIIVPLVNPDGYDFTFSPELDNRLWRKNRAKSYSEDPTCYGVDLNRNFGYHWNNEMTKGGSSSPCSRLFSGPNSFSEPETQNLRDLLMANRDDIHAYLTFHSFGQFFLYPWGFSQDEEVDDEDDLIHVASAFADKMRAKQYHYTVGGSARTLYPAAGASHDYVKGSLGIKYVYTVELPPNMYSKYGFLLPESEVPYVVSDTWAGLKAFVHRLHEHLKKDDRQRDGLIISKSEIPNNIIPYN